MKQIILLCGLLFLTGCQQPFFISEEVTVEFQFPAWPPQGNSQNQFPDLSRWILKSGTSDSSITQYISPTEKSIKISLKKNQPFSATLTPLIKSNSDSQEIQYFYPAGIIYPYISNENHSSFTWEQGFLADLMLKLINSKKETGVTSERMNTFLTSFNWKKAQENINKKLEAADDLYNPWFIDTQKLLENLSCSYFKASFLNLTNCYSLNLEEIENELNMKMLFPFVPANFTNSSPKQIILKNNIPILLSDCKTYGVIITVSSLKKVSKEIIFLPIFIEDI